jgi:hypothetical protein
MARPTKDDSKKLSTVLPPVRCTQKEKEMIVSRSKQAGMSMSEYLRHMALRGKINIRESQIDFEAVQQLRKIGINLNQATKKFNSTGNAPAELKTLWQKLDVLLTHFIGKV